jgi:hypothetical protein
MKKYKRHPLLLGEGKKKLDKLYKLCEFTTFFQVSITYWIMC